MNKLMFLTTILSIVLLSVSCKKDKNQEEKYKPRYIRGSYTTDFEVFDTRNTSNVKAYLYNWNQTDSIFEYDKSLDSTDFIYGSLFKKWPITLKDPVNAGGPTFDVHAMDRDLENKTYHFNYFEDGIGESTISNDHVGIPNTWTKNGIIDGYGYSYETYNSSIGATSYFFFDFDNNKYLIRTAVANLEEGNLSDFIKTPKGNMTTHNIDFKLVDAVFIHRWDDRFINESAFYFLDYDAQKYILVTRLRNSTSVDGKNVLRTTTWQPMSKLFDVWKF